jgi:hypothetical protein
MTLIPSKKNDTNPRRSMPFLSQDYDKEKLFAHLNIIEHIP